MLRSLVVNKFGIGCLHVSTPIFVEIESQYMDHEWLGDEPIEDLGSGDPSTSR